MKKKGKHKKIYKLHVGKCIIQQIIIKTKDDKK